MDQGTINRINQLIEQLKINDKNDPNEVDVDPKEPNAAMEELVRIGQPAVASLVKVLENPSNYSCVYAITVLGEIAAPEAAQPIIDAFKSDHYINSRVIYRLKDFSSEVYNALSKIGLPALEPTLTFLNEKREQQDSISMVAAMEILERIKDEKSFNTLIDLLSDEVAIKEAVINSLVNYGDKRAIEHLKKHLADDKEHLNILEAIKELTTVKEYREIMAPYALKDIRQFETDINRNLWELKRVHEGSAEFKGDNAEDLNSVSVEYNVTEAIDNLLHTVIQLGSYEAAFPNGFFGDFGVLSEIRSKWYDFKQENAETIKIINNQFPEDAISQVTKSYKGLVTYSDESREGKINQFLGKIQQWLKCQGFSVSIYHENLWAYKGAKGSRQGCFVSSGKDYERPRSWGTVNLGVWGNGWNETDANKFSVAFWDFTEQALAELIGARKIQSRIINHDLEIV